MKSISIINPAVMENTECLTAKVHTSFIDLKVGVLLNHGVSLRFVLLLALQTCWTTFQANLLYVALHLPYSLTPKP